MRITRTIFIKQAKDMFKNMGTLVQFIVFPVVALIMTELIAKADENIPDNMFVTMMGAIFVGFGLLIVMSSIIAEDIERKSLRFLVMAGVKPHQYLLGTGGFVLLAGAAASVLFILIGNFSPAEFAKLLAVFIAASAASIVLGASVGIISKNQQAATSIGMPVAMIFGFTPMIAEFSEPVAKVANILYTQQFSVIANDFSANFGKAMTVMLINLAVFVAFFIFVYRKRGLK